MELSIAALLASAIILGLLGEGAGAAKAALCFAGLLAARQMGGRRSPIAVLAIALLALVWAGTPALSGPDWAANTLAHVAGGALVAWVVDEWLAARRGRTPFSPMPMRWLAVLSLVLLIGAAWELGEWSSEALFGTDPGLTAADSAEDLLTDLIGAVGGLTCLAAFGAYRTKLRSSDSRPRVRGTDLPPEPAAKASTPD